MSGPKPPCFIAFTFERAEFMWLTPQVALGRAGTLGPPFCGTVGSGISAPLGAGTERSRSNMVS